LSFLNATLEVLCFQGWILLPICCDLASVGKKEPLSLLLSWWDGKENQKEKAKLLGWDKNSLTELHREK